MDIIIYALIGIVLLAFGGILAGMGSKMLFDKYSDVLERVVGVALIACGILMVLIPLALNWNDQNKLTQGQIVETGHEEKSCRTYYITVNNILVPNTTCTPAHDYIIITNGSKKTKIEVPNKDLYELGTYYESRGN